MVPQDPPVLAVEKDNKRDRKEKLERSCSACSVGQRCTNLDKMRDPGGNDLPEHYEPRVGVQHRERESSDSETPPGSPISSRTQRKGEQAIIRAPLREAFGPEGSPVLIKVHFSSFDPEKWKNVVKSYQSDSVGVTKHFWFLIKQHNPDRIIS